MASDSECTGTLESVRQFIASQGGSVKNSDLVTRFKPFLNHQQNRAENRAKFKDYVNTLASVKVDASGEKVLHLKKKFLATSETADTTRSSSSSSISSSLSKSQNENVPPDPPRRHTEHRQPPISTQGRSKSEENILYTNNNNDSTESKHEVKEEKHIEDVANMSVMERAKHLNKMQTESDLKKTVVKRGGNNHMKHKDGADDDSQSGGYVALNDAERQWLVTCCTADYHPMVQLLSHNPTLAKVRDFTNGFTALHWAAKHGKPEVIKMVAGKPGVNVNSRSHGGYTALHLAAMHSHEDIIELLVHTYKADPNVRDNSGKRPKQYLKNSASSRINRKHVLSFSAVDSKARSLSMPTRRPLFLAANQSPTSCSDILLA